MKYQLFTSILLLFFSVCTHAEIYKWVDDQGKVHYGDKPVQNSTEVEVNTSQQGNLQATGSREEKRKNLIDSFNEDRDRKNKEKAKRKKEKKKLERACLHAKDSLRSIERASYLYKLDSNGNRVITSNEDRAKQTKNLKDKIKKNCK